MAGAPDRLLQRLEWKVVRRLEGRLQGGHATRQRGSGIDFAGLRPYLEGDDARHIDWNVTARLGEPQLRQFTEDRQLTVWLVLDRSASMTAAGAGRGKHETLAELALLLARLFARGGDRVGAVLYDAGLTRVVPPGSGRSHTLRLAAELDRTTGARRGPTTDLALMLRTAASLARRRSLVLVVSDFISEGDWERALLQLAQRHEVVALRIGDAAAEELPKAGLIVVEDAETGELLLVDSGDPLLRARLRAQLDEREQRLAAGMRRAGVPAHRIDASAELARALVELVSRSGGAGP